MASDGSVRIKILGDNSDFRKKIDDTSVSLKNLKGLVVRLGFGAAFTKGVKEAVTATNSLENSIAKASTLFGDVDVNVDGLREKIQRLSSETGESADAIGNTLYNALSAGVEVTRDMGEAMAFLEANTRLAAAGFTDVDTSVQATAKVLNAYGKDVIDIDTVSRVLMNTQNLGITTLGELGNSLATVTPVAAAFGLSFEQVGASIAVMTKAGTDSATATTQLRAVLNALAQNGTNASKALEKAWKQVRGEAKTFAQLNKEGVTLQEMLRTMQTYAESTGLSLMDLFGEVRAGTGALQLAADSSQTFTQFLENMGSEADIVSESYEKVMGTRSKQWELLGNRLKNIAVNITMSAGAQKIMDKIQDMATAVVEKFEEWTPAIQRAFNIMYVTGSATITYLKKAFGELKNSLVIKPIIDYASESWKKFAQACESGDWTGIIKGINKGILIAIGVTGLASLAGSITTALGVSPLGLGLAALSIAVSIGEAKNGEKSWEAVGTELVLALAAGIGIGAFTGSPALGVLAFSIVMNLHIGTGIDDLKAETEAMREALESSFSGFDFSGYTKHEILEVTRTLTDGFTSDSTKIKKLANTTIGRNIILGILEGMGKGEDDLANLSEAEAAVLVSSMQEALGIHSPSTVFMEIAENIMAGLAKGLTAEQIQDEMKALEDAFLAFGEDLNEAILKGFDEQGLAFSFGNMVGNIAQAWHFYEKAGSALQSAVPIPSSSGGGADSGGLPGSDNAGTGAIEKQQSAIGKLFAAWSAGADTVFGDCERLGDYFSDLLDSEGALTERGQFWADTLNAGLQTAFSGFEALGESLAEGELSWGAFGKAGLEALASIIEAIGYQLLGQAVSAYPNFGQMAKAGAMSALMLVSAGLVRGWANQFESGGIVGGSGYTGDRHMIWANAGELILNRAQQGAIASQLGSSGRATVINIDFSGQVFGDQQEISEYVYDGIRMAQHQGRLESWQ